ncbi:MAG TPA: ExeM/NucH family extracellular endonuclease, partial [Thermoanaerobaculia bacterium]|nr:ExeM/NucH family extracellular endonuclease [Thermoanaerobaculia bacterium]
SGCPTPVAEGQRVRVTGSVSEFFNMTQITASTGGSVVVTDAGNNLAQVTPTPIDLPIAGDVNAFYEAREGMRVTFVDTLTVAEYFELFRFGHIELFEGGRPKQFTEISAPSAAGLTAHLDNLDRRRVILDDDNNTPNWPLTLPDGSQFVYHPHANGGFSVGTQGVDFFRGGDLVNGLTGVLHWSFAGSGSADAWRIRPTAATPVTFTVANPRPATAPAVGGSIKAAGMNLLNYFTTIDTTSSSSTGPCGPSMTLDCRGADSVAELNRQRERASIVICGINADVFGFMELENTTPTGAITDLLGAVNARCGGAHPYAFVNTGGTLGTDAIRVELVYRTGILSPVGSALVDLDPVNNRPTTAQTFDVVDAANPAFGERFTVIANHFKSKGCPGTGADADQLDGQGCFNATRTAQANRLLTWINSTVLPAAGDPDVLLLGDFNSYAKEDPVTTLIGGGFTDLETALLGSAAYSYLFDGQLGHLDYAFSSPSLTPQVTGVASWHINADEVPLFDYSDEVLDSPGEASFEEKPDGSALTPPRVVFQPASPFRASDHDPVLVGLFQNADLAIIKTDSADPVTAGTNLTYTITVSNNGPDVAANAAWSDTLPAGTTFVSLPAVAGWSCTTPAVGAGGTVSCSNPSFAVGNAAFTLTVAVAPSVAAGTVLSNTATVTSDTGETSPGNETATATTTVAASADLSVTKVDTPDPVTAGTNLTYTITVNNAGPSDAATVSLADTLPAGTTFVSLSPAGGWSCTTPAIGAGGAVTCTNASMAAGNAVFTLTVAVGPAVADGTVLSNTATVSSATSDPAPGNESATAATTVTATADLSVTKIDTPDPVSAGSNLTYTITVNNSGPSDASASLSDTLPAGTTFVSLASPGGWSCTTPAVGGTGAVTCSNAAMAAGTAAFTLTVNVGSTVTNGTVLTNTAAVTPSKTDGNPANDSATATTTVSNGATLTATKTASGTFVPGSTVTYTIVLTNTSTHTQGDNPGNELIDVLPSQLTLVSASATSGTAVPTVATNTVTWNGSLAGGASVTITIQATVNSNVAPGTTITNQATASFDSNGDGTNDGTVTTDDPAAGGSADPTNFTVVAAPAAAEIPTLDTVGLAMLVLLLAFGGAVFLRRRARS